MTGVRGARKIFCRHSDPGGFPLILISELVIWEVEDEGQDMTEGDGPWRYLTEGGPAAEEVVAAQVQVSDLDAGVGTEAGGGGEKKKPQKKKRGRPPKKKAPTPDPKRGLADPENNIWYVKQVLDMKVDGEPVPKILFLIEWLNWPR
jgi:hypothetical protein